MRWWKVPVVAMVVSCALGCAGEAGDEAPGASPPVEQAEAAERAAGEAPMPVLEVRAERVLAEVGDELGAVHAALETKDGALVKPRREALAALSPSARASMRRHNVRPEQLGRYLAARR